MQVAQKWGRQVGGIDWGFFAAFAVLDVPQTLGILIVDYYGLAYPL